MVTARQGNALQLALSETCNPKSKPRPPDSQDRGWSESDGANRQSRVAL